MTARRYEPVVVALAPAAVRDVREEDWRGEVWSTQTVAEAWAQQTAQLTGLYRDGWRLVAVAAGHAYLERAVPAPRRRRRP